MGDLLHFSPNPVTFEFTLNRQTTTFLNLRNVSEHPIAYKVKTNNVNRYCVCPSAAVIEPNAKMDVELKQQAFKEEPDDILNCSDRFLLQFARVDLVPIGNGVGKLHGYESALDLWRAIPNEVVQKAKFGVVLKRAKVSTEYDTEREYPRDSDVKSRSISTVHQSTDIRDKRSHDLSANIVVAESISTAVPQATTTTEAEIENVSKTRKARQEPLQSKSLFQAAQHSVAKGPGLDNSEFLSAPVEDLKDQNDGSDQKESSSETPNEIDYSSIEYARERARGIRTAPKISLLTLDEATKQRVAAERAGELARTIEARGIEIDKFDQDLSEARHRLHDAMAATAPAYDVKYEISESSRVPYAQIAIMAIISGAILQLLV